MHRWKALILLYLGVYVVQSHDYISERNTNVHAKWVVVLIFWWFLSSSLYGSDPGIALRQWVHFQGVHNILDLLSWDQEELKAVPAQQVYSLDDHVQG